MLSGKFSIQAWVHKYIRGTEQQQDQLIKQATNQILTSETSENLKNRYPNGFCCPHCESTELSKHSALHYEPSRKRYLCKSCKKTFNTRTKSLASGLHKPDQLIAVLLVLLNEEEATVRQIASIAKISVGTAHNWLKKIEKWAASHYDSSLDKAAVQDPTKLREKATITRHTTSKTSKQRMPSRTPQTIFNFSKVHGQKLLIEIQQHSKKLTPSEYRNSWPIFAQSIHPTHLPRNEINQTLIITNKISEIIGNFSNQYKKKRGLSYKHLPNYLGWFCYKLESNRLSDREKFIELALICRL